MTTKDIKDVYLDKDAVKRARTRKNNDRSRLMKAADDAFSKFIRTRDSQEFYGKAFRCISCGRILPIEQADCGHYINRRHMATRFSEDNCHAQCRSCNRFDEGNIYNYRKTLFRLFGEEKLLQLEASKHNTLKLSTLELGEIKKYYLRETKKFAYQINNK